MEPPKPRPTAQPLSPDESIVREVMHHGVVSCRLSTSVSEVAHRMLSHRISAVIVVDADGFLQGIVTQTDLVMARQGRSAEQVGAMTAGDILTPNVVTCDPDDKLSHAITLMTRNHIHRLVVVEMKKGRVLPVGVVSMTDIVRQTLGGGENIDDAGAMSFFGADPI